ncbi:MULTISPECIES: CDP-alcohol phosphatidyltransferase family protein [Nocardiopsis]|uniref:CDP-alcohol phosphatidyltransferase family protein n=1 Tax=Nocardiopsis TaxID=2013 RepID=UPI000345CA8D|nr:MULTISPECIES: CDP-alcohol phosphatidyltransferase family protein [Nocardiopsis]
MAEYTLDDVRERTCRTRDSWWTVAFVDPLAVRLVRTLANRTGVTPDQLTVGALFLGLGAAACFAIGSAPLLVAGAVLYYLCFLLDCMDGKLARLTDSETLFGSWMDYVFDRFRVLVCAIALMGGQYVAGGGVVFVWMALAVVFTDMLRYLNALQVYKMRREMRSRIAGVLERARAELSMLDDGGADGGVGGGRAPMSDQGEQAVLRHGISVLEQLLHTHTEKETRQDRVAGKQPDVHVIRPLPPVDLHHEFRSRFPWYQRIWDALKARRVRTHLVSGIEFQIAVFVLAPLAGALAPASIVGITVVAGVLLLAFEIAIIYKLWLSTRDYFRVVDGIEGALGFTRQPGQGSAPEPVAESSQSTPR